MKRESKDRKKTVEELPEDFRGRQLHSARSKGPWNVDIWNGHGWNEVAFACSVAGNPRVLRLPLLRPAPPAGVQRYLMEASRSVANV